MERKIEFQQSFFKVKMMIHDLSVLAIPLTHSKRCVNMKPDEVTVVYRVCISAFTLVPYHGSHAPS